MSEGQCTASVAAESASGLRPLLALGLPDRWPGFEVVKRSTVRTVLAGRIGDLPVHVKLYRAARWTDLARDRLLGARARVEFDNLAQARARGLPAAEPLAFGTGDDGGARSFLVTRTVPGAVPLPRGPLPAEQARALGRLLRRAHDAGLHAHDLHAGNVLVGEDGALTLIDLTSAWFGAPLELRDRARGLAFFLLDLDRGPEHPAAAPLLAGYGASPALHAATAPVWRRLRRRALVSFGRRATRACRHTSVERRGRRSIVYRHLPAGARADEAVARLAELDALAPVKQGRRGAVWLLDGIVAKRRARAAARRLFRAAYWCSFAGVDCATPLALVEEGGTGTVCVERIPAPDLAQRIARADLSREEAIAAAVRLGRSVGRLHAHGLRNRDMKLENLVLDPRSGAVVMVDLDGVRAKSASDRRGQAADLGRLLAAFRAAGSPGGNAALRAFHRGYTRARQCLAPSRFDRQLRRRIAALASAWASGSRSTSRS
ncbi:MAG TPA: lipopolysaccharide kinase InaA family protein [Planctomycetota bacterium]|nr:lipopolysaccharide kinase InaA family protein [Planctomycetota bacterium]